MDRALIDLRVRPASAVIKVDDTAPGVMEGVAAGCLTVGVALSGAHVGLTPEELTTTLAAAVVRLGAQVAVEQRGGRTL